MRSPAYAKKECSREGQAQIRRPGRSRASHRRSRAGGRSPMRMPIPTPRMIWGVGINYRDHAAETGRDEPTVPVLFVKSPSSVIWNGDRIIIPPHVTQPDYEGELAVWIGAQCRDVPAED